jgi:protein-S-isoprenylcysteine O-methyltransferase Ste14
MGSLIGLALIVALMFYGLHRRIVVEEKVMIAAFGDEYTSYMKRTKKIIPFIY